MITNPDHPDHPLHGLANERKARERRKQSRPQAFQRCSGTLGSKPWWMSWGQYDPCACRLPEGHDGDHWCEHLDTPDPRENGHAIAPEDPHQNGSPEVESVEVVRTVLDENRCGAHGLGPKLAPWCVLPRGHAGPHSGRSTDDG